MTYKIHWRSPRYYSFDLVMTVCGWSVNLVETTDELADITCKVCLMTREVKNRKVWQLAKQPDNEGTPGNQEDSQGEEDTE